MYGSLYGMMYTADAISNAIGQTATGGGSSRIAGAQRDVQHLEERLEKLILVNMALWEMLKERTELTELDLMNKVQEIDLRDGQADGKLERGVKKCPKCDRTMSPKHNRCLYCGAEDLGAGAYDI
jgi:NTP pyrophosphatase (non-canonical NTP hydrolase)